MEHALYALGLVLVAEGLIWALAPKMIEDLLAMLRQLGIDQRRMAGLMAVTIGIVLIWLAKGIGAF